MIRKKFKRRNTLRLSTAGHRTRPGRQSPNRNSPKGGRSAAEGDSDAQNLKNICCSFVCFPCISSCSDQKSRFVVALSKAPRPRRNNFVLLWSQERRDFDIPAGIEEKAKNQIKAENLESLVQRLRKSSCYYHQTSSKCFIFTFLALGLIFALPPLGLILYQTSLKTSTIILAVALMLTAMLISLLLGSFCLKRALKMRAKGIRKELSKAEKEPEFEHIELSSDPLATHVVVEMRNLNRFGLTRTSFKDIKNVRSPPKMQKLVKNVKAGTNLGASWTSLDSSSSPLKGKMRQEGFFNRAPSLFASTQI